MRIGLVLADSQTRIDEQDTAVRPGRQQPAAVGRCLVVWVLFLEGFVDVLERRGSRGWWADGKAEAMGLVGVVVRVLACYHNFDVGEGRVAGPVWYLVNHLLRSDCGRIESYHEYTSSIGG